MDPQIQIPPESPIESNKKSWFVKVLIGGSIVLLLAGAVLIIQFFRSSKLSLPGETDPVSSALLSDASIDGGPRVLFLGLDGANWPYIQEMITRGELPNFKKLLDSGTMGRIKTFEPPVSPPQWTSVATGKLPAKHGINNFVAGDDGSGTYNLVGSDHRQAKAIWNILEEKGFKIGLFGWTASYPIEIKNGYTISDIAVINPTKGIEPASVRNGIFANTAKILGLTSFINGVALDLPDAQDINDANYFAAAHKKFTLFNELFNTNSLYAFNKEKPDFLFQEDDVLDGTQHIFLKFKKPEEFKEPINPELQAKYGDFVDEIYRSKDVLLGEYLNLATPNTHVILFADSGFFVDPVSGWRFDRFNIILEILGFLKKNEAGQIDYANSIAFECGNNDFDWDRRLCINLEGRQVNGIVPQGDYEKNVDKILSALKALKTTDGDSLFNSIDRTYSTNGDIRYDLKRSSVDKEIEINGKVYPIRLFLTLSIESGAHYANPDGPPGFFIWSGPNIRKGYVIRDFTFMDFVPNILHSLGYPIGEDMDGKYLRGLYTNPVEPAYTPSYEENSNKI
ncbi:MAG: hypothetical protein COU35_04755 [Candidatus Magasanikbacteria bacterium CG10_big_fil_rev_8_21_14_0_10_47_10]|uniref:Phosphodiesterase n=1 Tax=Candidatus Magasanikbacteria bacterium CG10_big_fil_rev_8_21_14_0_10_47_10 TaxID=1974652 RepID=A0A2H0TPD8_9BACT|nr:MAG: hypothetical protein COU35_04755 [Candidatus Magasanikbacteria bacterium CG10_big_fil_rev_8_21_14_0_10_47_10]